MTVIPTASFRLPGPAQDATALLAGLSLSFAFAPYEYRLLGIIAPALLFAVLGNISARRGFWRGWLFGVGQFGAGIAWLHVTIAQFGGLPIPLAVVLTALFVAVLACYPALVGALAVRIVPRTGALRLLLLLPVLWALFEWLKGWLFSGFPWLNLAYTQIDTPLAQWTAVAGVYGLGWMLALLSALLVWSLQTRRLVIVRIPIALVVAAGFWVGAAQLNRFDWTHPVGQPLTVAVAQAGIPQAEKWLPANRQHTLDLYRQLTRPYLGAQLIVWPETAIPLLYSQAQAYLAELDRDMAASGSELLVGIPVRTGAGALHNSIISVGSGGRQFYHKQHLVPFGEYLPMAAWLQPIVDWLGVPMSAFQPGPARKPVLTVAGVPVGVSICYEGSFGEDIIRALPDAQLLVNVSNDAWFGESVAPFQHLEMARLRAVETGRFLVRATNTGISAIIDPAGRVVTRSGQLTAEAISASIERRAGVTPYARHGNTPVVVLLLLAGVMVWWRGRP